MRGIDIAHYQGKPLNAIASKAFDQSDFVIVKATQSTSGYSHVDYFKFAIEKAINAGKLCGAYHYADGRGAIAEADYFVSVVKPYLGKIMLALDWETGKTAGSKNYAWGSTTYAKQFMDRVYEKTGVRCMLYTGMEGISQCKNCYPTYKLWFAGYPNLNDSWTPPAFPSRYKTSPWPKYDIWQYTNSNSKLDRNTTNLTKSDWNNLIKSSISKTTTNTTKGSETKVSINFNNYYNKISNSGHDQRGRYNSGAAGDQTGAEWAIINWYNRPWACVLRHPDKKVRELIAELAIEAANNNNIGYDQYQRDTYETQLKKSGNRPKNITVKCEADCSAGVCANVRAVGRILNISALKNLSSTYTGNMRSGFRAAGFQVLTDSKYLTSSAYLLPGDILLNDGHHTATNLGIGSKSGGTVTNSDTGKNNTSTSTKDIQTMLNNCGWSLGVDNDYGPKTTAAVKEFQTIYNVKISGNVDADTIATLKAANQLVKEGFNATIYANNYPDVKKAYGTDKKQLLHHYYAFGKKENRNAKTAISSSTKPATPVKPTSIPLNTSGTYNKTKKATGQITTLLNIRKGPGTNYSNLVSYPTLKSGTKVEICDAVKNKSTGTIWYYIKISGSKGDKYGFASSNYIKIV